MPDRRRHRGMHPQDLRLFSDAEVERMRAAVFDLSWLLTRGYPPDSSLKLVGDRYRLRVRQRLAVARCACSDQQRADRRRRLCVPPMPEGTVVAIDGFNVLTTVEAALSGGVILAARDGCYRDLVGMHGHYRKVAETRPAVERIATALQEMGANRCRWLFDAPVSNSGRVAALVREVAGAMDADWHVEVLNDPDRALIHGEHVAASADSVILDRCKRWINLARRVVDTHIPSAWVVDLSGSDE